MAKPKGGPQPKSPASGKTGPKKTPAGSAPHAVVQKGEAKASGAGPGSALWVFPAGAILAVVTAVLVYDPTIIGLSRKLALHVHWVAVPIALLLVFYYIMVRRSPEVETTLAGFARTMTPKGKAPTSLGPLWSLAPVQTSDRGLKTSLMLPRELVPLIDEVGPGETVVYYELHEKVAYLAVSVADLGTASDFVSVVMQLKEAGPDFDIRPLVLGDAAPPNHVGFSKDARFTAKYVVEGGQPKVVRAWLNEDLREELTDAGDLFVQVRGATMSITAFGPFDVERALRLVDVADLFFLDYGAVEDVSLREVVDRAAPPGARPQQKVQPPPPKRPPPPPSDEEEEEEEEEEDEEDEGEEEKPAAAKKADPAKTPEADEDRDDEEEDEDEAEGEDDEREDEDRDDEEEDEDEAEDEDDAKDPKAKPQDRS